MAKQTINIGASPNDGTGTPLRTSFDYCNLNFTELYTAVGPSGNNIVCPGSATITGDLTVDTNVLKVDTTNNRVGIGTASPDFAKFEVSGGDMRMSLNQSLYLYYGSATNYASLRTDNSGNVQIFTGVSSPANRFQIANDGVCTWSNVGGTSGPAMTLNATGLGVGVASPATKLDVRGANNASQATFSGTAGRGLLISTRSDSLADDRTVILNAQFATGSLGQLVIQTAGTDRLLVDNEGNVGIGVTPITPHILSCAGPVAISGTNSGTRTSYITNSNTASIYYTDGGGSGYFTDFGNLIIQPRTSAARSVVIATGSTTPVERAVVKSTGQVRFVPLAADPAGAEAGDVYYNSVSNRLKYYNGTAWTLI